MTQRLNAVALANTFAIIDIVFHPLFHVWIAVHPRSYELLMQLFVAGLHLEVSEFDASFSHVVVGTIVEAAIFWTLGYVAAALYNKLAQRQQ